MSSRLVRSAPISGARACERALSSSGCMKGQSEIVVTAEADKPPP